LKLWNKQKITCQLCIDENLAKSLLLDDLRLRQILQNLLSNSIKFTQEGFVSISCKVLNNTHAEQLVEISVADTGIGITNTEIERLLKPYEQSKLNDLSTIPGTGLGLSITAELLKSLGSELTLDSQMGLGTTASFNLKLKRSTAKALNHVRNTSQRQRPSAKLDRKTILIVDDHEASREVLRVQVEQLGYKSILAHDAHEAIELTTTLAPDILITDESMPGISGRELAKRIRSSFPQIKIIGLTADVFAQQQQSKYLESGMNCVLVKPISLSQLENHLNSENGVNQPLHMTKSWDVEFLERFTGQDERLEIKIIKAIYELQKFAVIRWI
jgi:two-component system sensor histidine kinase EvgS